MSDIAAKCLKIVEETELSALSDIPIAETNHTRTFRCVLSSGQMMDITLPKLENFESEAYKLMSP